MCGAPACYFLILTYMSSAVIYSHAVHNAENRASCFPGIFLKETRDFIRKPLIPPCYLINSLSFCTVLCRPSEAGLDTTVVAPGSAGYAHDFRFSFFPLPAAYDFPRLLIVAGGGSRRGSTADDFRRLPGSHGNHAAGSSRGWSLPQGCDYDAVEGVGLPFHR